MYSGANGGIIRTFSGGPGTLFGISVSACQDLNADGVSDLIIGEPYAFAGFDNETGASRMGRAWIYSTQDGLMIKQLRGEPDHIYGLSVVGSSLDADGDGVGELVVTAPLATDISSMESAEFAIVSPGTGFAQDTMTVEDLLAANAGRQQSDTKTAPDVNDDGVVNAQDLEKLSLALSGVDGTSDASLDINGDGSVNTRDLEPLFESWGDAVATPSALRLPGHDLCKVTALIEFAAFKFLTIGCGLTCYFGPNPICEGCIIFGYEGIIFPGAVLTVATCYVDYRY